MKTKRKATKKPQRPAENKRAVSHKSSDTHLAWKAAGGGRFELRHGERLIATVVKAALRLFEDGNGYSWELSKLVGKSSGLASDQHVAMLIATLTAFNAGLLR